MTSPDNEEHEYENNKTLITSLAQEDGQLVSPIDLSLDNTRHLLLERLKWMNFANTPVKMKLTNTGETVIISGKWSQNRPYLCGGPLNGNYVFSQVHFHWGSDEHEGSEHTVRGISYPMEVHVVFYKSRYLTQDAALKKEDGVIVVVYLVRLTERSTPGIHWLANHLEKVVQPQTSAPLPQSPLSALLVPFTMDYLLYWGLLVTHRCSHTMLWLVSRVAFSITVEHLNMFRKLLNSRKEPMNKNFRGASPTQGRTVVHANPSKDNKHLLLPGTIDPPDHAIVVNYTHMPPLDYVQAVKNFNKGDSTDDEKKKEPHQPLKIKSVHSSSKTYTFCEGSKREEMDNMNKCIQYKKSPSEMPSKESFSLTNGSSPKPIKNRPLRQDRAKSQRRKHVQIRKTLEKTRRQGIENLNKFINAENFDIKLGKVIRKSYSEIGLKKVENHETKQTETDENNNESSVPDIKKEDENSYDFCQQTRAIQISSEDFNNSNLKNKTDTDKFMERQSMQGNQETPCKETLKGQAIKSRIPMRTKGLQSSLAPYFSQSESTNKGHKTSKLDPPISTSSSKLNNDIRKPVTTTIPKPIGKNAGKIEENCGIHSLRQLQRRPASSPTKLSHQKK